MPKEVDRPIKAMEQVISNFWVLYDPPDFKEKWVEGKFLLSFSLDIVGIDGTIHFFLRIPEYMRKIFESAIYSQYPEVEIELVDDYTKRVPQNIPNQDWDLWACNFKFRKKNCYPIKTYASFFEPSPDVKEEKRIDPLAVLVEGMSRLQKGEQLWLQLILKPVANEDVNPPWADEGKAEINKLVNRPSPSKPKSITGEAIRTLVYGTVPFAGEEKPKEIIPPEMKLTPGERATVQAIENKISKNGFEATMRMILLGKRDVFFKANLRLILNFSVGLSTQDLNGIRPFMTTKIVPPSPFRDRRLFLRKRDLFKRYVRRWTPHYPKYEKGDTFILNAEEIATIFHFPGKVGAPTPSFARIEAKKGGPPINLPIE